MRIERATLEGDHVRLEPLDRSHEEGICDAIRDGKLWELEVTIVPHPDDIDGFFDHAFEIEEAGTGLAFATIDKASGRIAGSTRYLHANLFHKRLEIGFTFLGHSWQRTAVNTEAKLLMLEHSFEVLSMNRVAFLTDELNTVSQTAILRIGARYEGKLRNHMIMSNGRIRTSMVYSVIQTEWPTIKGRLQDKLSR